jgi:SAM-dependent methyltransferase
MSEETPIENATDEVTAEPVAAAAAAVSVAGNTKASTLGLCAISASTLIVEILITKFLAYKLYHHFAYAVISMVILSFGAAGAFVFMQPKLLGFDQKSAWQRVSMAAALYSFSLVCSILFFCWMPLDPFNATLDAAWRFLSLPLYFIVFGIPFFFAGLCISHVFSASKVSVAQLYFWDLSAAAIGAGVCSFALELLGGYGTIFLASLLGLVACFAFKNVYGGRAPTKILLLYLFSAGVLLVYPQWSAGLYGFDIRSSKDPGERTLFKQGFGGIKQTYWNPVARIDVSGEGDSRNTIYRYGLADRDNETAIPGRIFLVDGGANTRQFKAIGAVTEKNYLGHALWASPYVACTGAKRALVIGGGGGIDILVAKYFRIPVVDVVELNPSTYKLLTGGANDPEKDAYLPWLRSDGQTEVNIFNREGRSFCSNRQSNLYDVIQASGVDTLTAVTTGGMSLVENYLYTAEAVKDYARVLKPEGVISLSHWRKNPPSMALRMFLTFREYQESEGNKEPWRNLLVVAGYGWTDTLMKKTPFSKEEVASVRNWAKENGWTLLFDPYDQHPPGLASHESIYSQLGFADADARRAILDSYLYDVKPVNDDRPYFYQIFKSDNFFQSFWGPLVRAYSLSSTVAVFICLTLLASVILILAPLAKRDRPKLTLPIVGYAGYFAISGFAFMLFETSIIQSFGIFVGGPFYSLVVVLVCVLAGYSIGSWLAQRLTAKPRTFLILAGALSLLLLCVYIGIRPLIIQFMPLPLPIRVAICAAVTLLVSIPVGMPVALAMNAVRDKHGTMVAWLWGVNSAFNALGAISFVALAQGFGIAATLLLAAALYLIGNLIFALAAPKAVL